MSHDFGPLLDAHGVTRLLRTLASAVRDQPSSSAGAALLEQAGEALDMEILRAEVDFKNESGD